MVFAIIVGIFCFGGVFATISVYRFGKKNNWEPNECRWSFWFLTISIASLILSFLIYKIDFLDEAKEKEFLNEKCYLGKYEGKKKAFITNDKYLCRNFNDVNGNWYSLHRLCRKVVAKFTLNCCSLVNKDNPDFWFVEDNSLLSLKKIDNLEIFETPKELKDFGLKLPPQSWQYINIEKDVK